MTVESLSYKNDYLLTPRKKNHICFTHKGYLYLDGGLGDYNEIDQSFYELNLETLVFRKVELENYKAYYFHTCAAAADDTYTKKLINRTKRFKEELPNVYNEAAINAEDRLKRGIVSPAELD